MTVIVAFFLMFVCLISRYCIYCILACILDCGYVLYSYFTSYFGQYREGLIYVYLHAVLLLKMGAF